MTLGSRGDVQPYVALSKELIARGHRAKICTRNSFKNFIESYGIEYAKVELDLMKILETEEGQQIQAGGIINLPAMLKYVKEVVNPAFRKSLDDFWEAAKGADMIIYHPKVTAAADIANALHIPCVSMPPVPITYPVDEFPNLALFPKASFGKHLNRASYKMVEKADLSNIKEINDFRMKILTLQKRKAGEFASKINGTYIPIVYPISPFLFQDVTSWKDRVHLPGFFLLNDSNESLDPSIINFLDHKDKPTIVSFSSMPLKKPELFKRILLETLEKTNNRAIILTGISGMTFENNDRLLTINKAPHNLLFPNAKGIIHHGGVGTLAEASRSAVPQLIIPFVADQPFWANRLYKLGFTMKPLTEKNISTNKLIASLTYMERREYISAATSLAEKISAEQGVKNAVDFLENLK